MLNAKNKVKSYSLIFIQFAAIAILLVSDSVFIDNLILLIIQISGLFLGIWALYVMGRGNINIPPDLKENIKLTQKGPYKVIRHPMYSAIILTLFPLVIENFSIFRLIIFIILIADLVYKLHWEEKMLLKRFPEYSTYQKKSSRIIPFIY